MNDQSVITHAPLKAATAIGAGMLGQFSLSDWASILAIIYTLILIGEWIYKRFIMRKPFSQPLNTDKAELRDE